MGGPGRPDPPTYTRQYLAFSVTAAAANVYGQSPHAWRRQQNPLCPRMYSVPPEDNWLAAPCTGGCSHNWPFLQDNFLLTEVPSCANVGTLFNTVTTVPSACPVAEKRLAAARFLPDQRLLHVKMCRSCTPSHISTVVVCSLRTKFN